MDAYRSSWRPEVIEKLVEVPIATLEEQIVEVPKVEYMEFIREVPRPKLQKVQWPGGIVAFFTML